MRPVADRPDITHSTDLLVAVLGHAIKASRFACRDLTDEEYFWEPVTLCWGIRRRGESDAPNQGVSTEGGDAMPFCATVAG